MKCVKCNSTMVKANVNTIINIYGDVIKNPPCADYQKSYSPIYAYVCEECGYIEFYTKAQDNK